MAHLGTHRPFQHSDCRVINFESGYYKDLYRGNVFAIGLSGGFFEPLEATSLMTVCEQLLYFIRSRTIEDIVHKDYNKFFRNVNNQTLLYLKYHYLNIKDDTPFWKSQFNSPLPNDLYKLMNKDFTFKAKSVGHYKDLIGMTDDREYLFPLSNWRVFSKVLIEEQPLPVHAKRSIISKLKGLLNLN